MSTYNFEILNAASEVIADGNYPVYTILEYGSAKFNSSVKQTYDGNKQYYTRDDTCTITFQNPIPLAALPMVFIEAPGYMERSVTILSYNGTDTHIESVIILGSDNLAITPANQLFDYELPYNSDPNFNYLIAAPISYANTIIPDYGLVIYDENGKMTFNSAAKLLNIKYMGSFNSSSVIAHPTITGKRYVSLTRIPSQFIDGKGGSGGGYAEPANNYFGGFKAKGTGTIEHAWNYYLWYGFYKQHRIFEYDAKIIIAELGA